MTSINQNDFINKFPNWKNTFNIYRRDDSVFQRIKIEWKENKQLTHMYHACINTSNGDIYLDCRRRKIFAKHLTLFIARPLHTIIKTIWHASIIAPLSLEIYKTATGKQTIKTAFKHTVQSLADIIRTPLYGIAITITHLAALILAPFSPNSLYRTRQIVGFLERKLLRVENILDADFWALSACFSPIRNIKTIHNRKNQSTRRNKYTIMSGLERFASSQIEFRRNHKALFNDCFQLYPENQRYISSASSEKSQ